MATHQARSWYETAYALDGFGAQRRYPNEELLRFFGRHYFGMPRQQRSAISVLDIGCGAGANLWMIAHEGFDAHGIDFSQEAIDLCRRMLDEWGATATLQTANMTAIPYPDRSIDVITDVFSSNCLTEREGGRFLAEIARLLRPGGRFFSYIPSKVSDAFRDPGPSHKIDASTLDGIRRDTAPFAGNHYPFRFVDSDEYARMIEGVGLSVSYCEAVGRTYRRRQEYFEFVIIVAEAGPPATGP